MTEQPYNPFSGIDLITPVGQQDTYNRYCQSAGNANADRSPFPRKVDLWFCGLTIAVREELSPADLSNQKTEKIIEGSIFDTDTWRVEALMLTAIALEDDVEIVQEPRRIMAIANGLAAEGVPYIDAILSEGKHDPIWKLSDALYDMLRQ